MSMLNDAIPMFGSCLLENSEDMREFYKETCGGLAFNGNKIIAMDKELDTNWARAFIEMMKAHGDWV